ncbi:hypothetical protein TTHERM_00607090 (macronuclear) [Tetrahymena thermophila SB210]|uniref:Uncharacterized protein n=1 Tax=Tetrahymena thermophila (strain SB210) TaxID=312017 RepID=Q22YI2_TETTS|nr:hypothetical protein TTHERM_00607090 [Tetrahymena thermophila SB210]EAR90303.1 hypothetical protein TTHERM_00607090 [Tetrahymena thermophila SB210]|eukprot:XP_001010548.1 hypothetical protein TTHERM_00607090 [Tetrahymena thermophila SB210]
MIEEDKKGEIIMKNILYLGELYNRGNQRNLLNKWFQDSIKNYVLESIASPLIAKYIHCSSSARVKDFILKRADKSKPKYMGIMEQYFFQINKHNQGDRFKERLNAVLLNPIDYSTKQFISTYNNEKTIRKQFVCYLILRYFESYDKHQFPSFYELWNFCFPEEAQIKKKLSRFDEKVGKKRSNCKININISNNDTNFSSESFLKNRLCISIPKEVNSFNQESPSNNDSQTFIQRIQIQNQFEVQQQQEDSYVSQQIKNYPKKKQINNHIFEDHDDDYEDDIQEKDVELQESTQQQFPIYEKNSDLFQVNEFLQYNQNQQYKNYSLSNEYDQNLFYFYNQQYYLPIQETIK